MRKALVIGLALVAVLAAGVWALGQFGGSLTGGVGEPQAPIVREPELVVAEAQPQPPASNPQPSLRSAPATPAPATTTVPAATPTPTPVPAEPAQPEAPPAAEPTTPPAAQQPAQPQPQAQSRLKTTLDGSGGLTLPGLTPRSAPSQTPPAATPAPQPEQAPAAQPQQTPPPSQPAAPPAQQQQARVAEPRVAPQQAPAAAAVAAAPAGLEAQFKSRKVTYNRPPQKLALDKPMDVSLVINATADVDAGQKALEGFQGEIVERDVDLSDTVSAQLTGVGFDITSQTVERQRLSGRVVNRWAWRVTPTETGTHTLILEIFGYATGSLDAEPLDAYRDEITVEVQQFDQIVSWARGVQPVFAVLAAMAGVGSAIFAFLRFREEKKQTKAKPKTEA